VASTTASDPQQNQNLDLRESLDNAYAYIEGQKNIQTFSALTFEECMDEQINDLIGPDTPSRPNTYNRITKIGAAVMAAVAQIKAAPANAFVDSDPSTDVNTQA
jgi:hypothetical protein